jgi:uncharacterized protein involved in exopolysaccharide biosynthesis
MSFLDLKLNNINYQLGVLTAQSGLVNVANTQSIAVPQLVTKMEQFLSKKAMATTLDKGYEFQIDTTAIQPILKQLKLSFEHDYVDGLLKKYYQSEL